MSRAPNAHPSRERLAAFDAGQLAPAEREAIERHLAACPRCGRELDTLPEDPFVALVRASAATSARAATDTPQPLLPDVPDALARHPRYRILEVLGAGGMGVVYKAVHRVMDRVIALKVLHRRFTDHPDFVERFRQEAQALARLAHRHIALAHDAEQAGDLHFLVLEHVPGLSLDRLVAQHGPLPVAEACAYVRQAALGLQHAFEHGLVHRDVKPANLMRTPAGQIKVLDFGLAQMARARGEKASPSSSGAFAGTPDYTAPEQARDRDCADIRADVYGLGGTLYFLLTAQPPFPGGTTLQKLLAHQDRLPSPLRQLRADVPEPLAALVERMLAKDPVQRPATPAEVARLLAPFAGAIKEPPEPLSADPPLRRRWPWFLAAGLLVAVGLIWLCSWLVSPAKLPPGETSPQTEKTPEVPLEPPPSTTKTPSPALDFLALATDDERVKLRRQRRDEALAWFRANHSGPEGTLIQDLADDFARHPDEVDGFHILIGPRLLRSQQPTLLAAALGGFFVFPLSAEQSRTLTIKDGSRRFYSYRKIANPRRALPRLRLSDLKIDHAERWDARARITGSLTYEVRGPALRAPFAVGLSRYLDKGKRRTVLVWFEDRQLEGRGTLRITCPPLAVPNTPPHSPVVLFAEMFASVDGRLVIESDTVAALVETAPAANSSSP